MICEDNGESGTYHHHVDHLHHHDVVVAGNGEHGADRADTDEDAQNPPGTLVKGF